MAERVWERFLTEQDKVHLGTRTPTPIGFGEKPALLLIDLYRGVFGDEPKPLMEAIKEWPGSCGMAAWDSVPHIQTLLQAARDAAIPVIHVTGINGDIDGVEPWAVRRESQRPQDMSPEAQERRSRRWEIIDEVTPIPGETVLRKASPSAFYGTPLAAHLNYLGVDTVIVCGESTSGCVRASVVDGCTYRYRVTVVEECVFDRHETAHAMNLFDMNQKYADVLSLGDVLEYLAAWSAERKQGAAKS
jgi:nicotinamidase-related amidase